MWYVIDKSKGYVVHQGDNGSCGQYVRNVASLFGKSGFAIVKGAKARDAMIKELKRS